MPYKDRAVGVAHSRAYYLANKAKWKNPDGSWRIRPKEARRAQLKRWYWERGGKALCATTQKRQRARCRVVGVCPICQVYEGPLVRDHDHITGLLREALCQSCNLMLGHSKETIRTLRRGALYLKRHKAG